jgi:hypothetical protein
MGHYQRLKLLVSTLWWRIKNWEIESVNPKITAAHRAKMIRTINTEGNQNNPLFPEKLSFPRLILAAVFSASYIPKTQLPAIITRNTGTKIPTTG